MAARTVTGIVIATERKGVTRNGNPIIDVTLSTPTEGFPGTVTLRLAHDSSLSYGIENKEFAEKPHIFGVSRAGRLDGTAEEAGF